MNLNIKKLFYLKRFGNFSGITALMFIMYIPCGLLLLLFRCLISLQYLILMMLLPKNFFFRRFLMWFYFAIMGMFISTGGTKHKKEKVAMIISNHVSYLDSIALEAVVPSWRLRDHTKLPSWFAWLFGFKNPEVRWMEDVKSLRDNVEDFPYAFFPEEETTNGKVGLLQYNSSTFKLLDGYVQPIIILIHRPWFIPINANYSESTFWSDLLWFLFVPVTLVHTSYLPPVEIENNEDKLEEFVKTLQKDMSYVLGVEATNHTAHDKREYIKRRLHEEKIRQQQVIASSSYENNQSLTINRRRDTSSQSDQVTRMGRQVSSVLPQVPIDVIMQDIKKTRDVDKTITNLLDGSVPYTPLTEAELERTKTDNRTANVSPKPPVAFNSYKDWNLSFQDRKERMIEEARRKYLQLHPEWS